MIKRISDKRKAKGERLAWNSTIKAKSYTLKKTRIKKVSDKSRKLWDECRKKVFEKYGRKCLLCGQTEGELHVHHWNFTRTQDPSKKYDIDNLCVLCSKCHNHNGADLEFYILREKIKERLKKKGIE